MHVFKTREKAQLPYHFLIALLGNISQAASCSKPPAITLRKCIKISRNAKAFLSMWELAGLP